MWWFLYDGACLSVEHAHGESIGAAQEMNRGLREQVMPSRRTRFVWGRVACGAGTREGIGVCLQAGWSEATVVPCLMKV